MNADNYYDKLLALLLTGDPESIDLARFIISQIPTKRKKKEMCDRLVEGYFDLLKFDIYMIPGCYVWRTTIPSYFGYYEKYYKYSFSHLTIYLHDYSVENDIVVFNITFMKLSKFLYCYKPKQE